MTNSPTPEAPQTASTPVSGVPVVARDPRGRGPRTAALLLAAVLIALVAGAVGGVVGWTLRSTPAAGSNTCDAVSLANQVLPSVVTIRVSGGEGGQSNGSGEVVRSSGYILTNDHVIAPGADGGSFTVQFSAGQTMPATLVGRVTALDLAVIKVQPPEPLPVIAIGSSAVPIGLPVVALGAPLGLDSSVTKGIISALGRDVTLPAANGQTALISDGLQTDAAINPGNSGGPLVNCDGQMVGVNTAIATVPNAAGGASSGSVGIGFAIPSDLASAVADQLIATGTFSMPRFGVAVVPMQPSIAAQFDLPAGLFVRDVVAGGGAEAAGLKIGDIITAVDGQSATNETVLIKVALAHRAGDQIPVTFYRAGASTTVSITLGGS